MPERSPGDRAARPLSDVYDGWVLYNDALLEVLDNATVLRNDLAIKVRKRHGSAHKATRPYGPRTNGKAERFLKIILRDWA
ncbi:MAG: hypothetical protein ACOVT5_15720 [Armatimonadaceae bacterium]|jgi:hypothetical protein